MLIHVNNTIVISGLERRLELIERWLNPDRASLERRGPAKVI